MKYLIFLLLSGCTVETTDDISVVELDNENKVVIHNPDTEKGSSPCSPAMVLEVNGKVYYQPILCPYPKRPDPDPASGGLVMPIEKLQNELGVY